ncbi:MAG: hypothetical protein ACYCU3_17670, partial [Streptosporangiaceae bacterium]
AAEDGRRGDGGGGDGRGGDGRGGDGRGGDGGGGADVARGEFSHGGWTARRPGGGPVELTGSGTPTDGLRVLCAVAWSGRQLSADQVSPALAGLGLD